MRVTRALLPAILLVAVALAGCVQGGEGSGALRGQKAPAFVLTSLENETVGTNASQGKVLFIDFMGARCATCHLAMRELVPLQEEFHEDVDFVSVDVGSYTPGLGGRNAEELRGFRDKYNASWPFAMDTLDQNTAARYEVLALPTAVLVDQDGVVACRESGVSTQEHLAGWINHTLDNGYDPDFRC